LKRGSNNKIVLMLCYLTVVFMSWSARLIQISEFLEEKRGLMS
jgi:hypothetical protein